MQNRDSDSLMEDVARVLAINCSPATDYSLLIDYHFAYLARITAFRCSLPPLAPSDGFQGIQLLITAQVLTGYMYAALCIASPSTDACGVCDANEQGGYVRACSLINMNLLKKRKEKRQ